MELLSVPTLFKKESACLGLGWHPEQPEAGLRPEAQTSTVGHSGDGRQAGSWNGRELGCHL